MEFNIFAKHEDSLLYISVETSQKTIINFAIRNMLDAQIVSVQGGQSVNIKKDDLNIIVFKHEETIVVQFMNKNASPEGYTMQFDDVVNAVNNNTFSVNGENNVFMFSERCTCMTSENHLNIYPSGVNAVITLYVPKDSLSAMMSSMSERFSASSTVYSISNSGVLPEFSIAVYDDSSRVTPRPIRLGIPVISTVPVYRTGLSDSELQILELGLGTSKRTMYFKIISNVVIPDTIEPVLHIYLPSNIGAISEPQIIEMTRQISSDSTRSVFYASHTFYKEDTIQYLDGYAYLSVYMPMEISADLPISMAVTTTGDDITNPYADDPNLG